MQALTSCSGIFEVQAAHDLTDARGRLAADSFNTVFIDPLSTGLDEASEFVFGLRKSRPDTVFVLYIDKRLVEHQRGDFYLGQRSRFLHYFTLDKRTPANRRQSTFGVGRVKVKARV